MPWAIIALATFSKTGILALARYLCQVSQLLQ